MGRAACSTFSTNTHTHIHTYTHTPDINIQEALVSSRALKPKLVHVFAPLRNSFMVAHTLPNPEKEKKPGIQGLTELMAAHSSRRTGIDRVKRKKDQICTNVFCTIVSMRCFCALVLVWQPWLLLLPILQPRVIPTQAVESTCTCPVLLCENRKKSLLASCYQDDAF